MRPYGEPIVLSPISGEGIYAGREVTRTVYRFQVAGGDSLARGVGNWKNAFVAICLDEPEGAYREG